MNKKAKPAMKMQWEIENDIITAARKLLMSETELRFLAVELCGQALHTLDDDDARLLLAELRARAQGGEAR